MARNHGQADGEGTPAESASRPTRAFVGRAREVDVARSCLAEALAGHGGALVVAGDPGIGKTRFAEMVQARAQELAAPVVWGRCVQEEGAPPFWPWRQVLRACLAALGDELPPGARRYTADLAILVPELRSSGTRVTPLAAAGPPGGEERFRLFESATRFLVESALPAGLVVVLDDLHWADPPSALLLAHLARDLVTSRVLVVATYRDREVGRDHPAAGALASLARERGTVHVRLEGLAEVDVADQLEAVFAHRFEPEIVAGVTRRSGGNPLFVAEIGRVLETRRSSDANDVDSWRTDLPEGVRAVIAQRIDRLPPGCQELLRTAAVIGTDIDASTIAAVRGRPTIDAMSDLDDALEAGLVVATDRASSMEFSHALVRETLVAQVSTAQRLEIHRRVAEHIEGTYPDDLARHATQLAHHWLAALPAADARHAVQWAEEAAADAYAHLAYEDAARLYQRALEAIDASGGFGAEDRGRLLVRLAEAHFKCGDIQSAIAAASAAGDEARRRGDPRAAAQAVLVLDGVSDDGWSQRVLDLCDDAVPRLGDEDTAVRARLIAATATVYSLAATESGPDRSELVSREALALAERTGDPAALVSALRSRQMACASPDAVHDRLQVAERMLLLAAETGDHWASLWGRLWRLEAQCQLGEIDAAEADLGPLSETVERLRQPIASWHLARTRCSLAIGRGRFADAGSYLDEAVAIAGRGLDTRGQIMHAVTGAKLSILTGDPRYDPWIALLEGDSIPGSTMAASTALALSYATAGQLDRALQQYRRLPPLPGWRVPRFVALVVLSLRARVAAIVGDTDGAADAYGRLLPWAGYNVVGGTALVAMHGSTEFVLGCLADCLGRTDAAVRHLRSAVAANARSGLPPFVVESRYELAKVLAARSRREDRSEALASAVDAARAAAQLGMRPVQTQVDGLIESLRRSTTQSGSLGLTRRELDIAALVARGLTNRQIGNVLHIAERTAENHLQHILTKLGLQNRTQVAAWATSQRLDDRPGR